VNGLRQLYRDVRSQKLRTFLTVFGIVWGTVAVSLLLAFGRGFHEQIRVNSAGLGENICIAWPSLTSIPFQGWGRAAHPADRRGHGPRGGEGGRSGRHLGEYSGNMKLTYGTKTLAVEVSGITPDFADLRNLIPQAAAASSTPSTCGSSVTPCSSAISWRRTSSARRPTRSARRCSCRALPSWWSASSRARRRTRATRA